MTNKVKWKYLFDEDIAFLQSFKLSSKNDLVSKLEDMKLKYSDKINDIYQIEYLFLRMLLLKLEYIPEEELLLLVNNKYSFYFDYTIKR